LGYRGDNEWRVPSEIQSEPNDFTCCFNFKMERYKHVGAIDTNSGKYRSKVIDKKIGICLDYANAGNH
jgi:hypothetical protein